MKKWKKRFVSIMMAACLVFTDGSVVCLAEEISEQQTAMEKTEETEELSLQNDSEESDSKEIVGETTEQENADSTEMEVEDVKTSTDGNDTEITEEQGVTEDGIQEESTTESVMSQEETIDTDTEIVDSDAEAEAINIYSWNEWKVLYASNYRELSKEERLKKRSEYEAYRLNMKQTNDGVDNEKATSGMFSNQYLEVAVAGDGRFTIGNVEGNPDYTSDNGQILLYGHPDPGTSETLIKVGEDEYWFEADSSSYTDSSAISIMTIDKYNIKIVQSLQFVKSGNALFADTVRISYRIINQGTSTQNVGIRIMIDTMLADNDNAPFKVTGKGNITRITNYTGSAVPSSYQVYDNLDNPTTLASGYLKKENERVPDKVQFTSWPDINDSGWDYEGNVGSDLGDSAVGIYFYPTAVGKNQSAEVATYYGVGLGSMDGASQSGSVKGDKLEVTVKESGTGTFIKDAKVTITKSGTDTYAVTDAKGDAVFDGFTSKSQKVSFKVEKEGFNTREIEKIVKGGTKVVLSMKSDTDTTPIVEQVTLDGNDILNNTVHYIENSNKEIEKSAASKVKEVTIKAEADMENCTYYLIEDEKTLEVNKTGIFKLKTVDVTSGTIIDKLKSGSSKYIQCVSADGKKSQKMVLGIKVSIPSVVDKKCTNLKFWPSEGTKVADSGLGKLFLGDKVKFGLENPKDLNVVIETTEDGTLQVGVNMKKMPQSAVDRKKVYEAFRDNRLPKKLTDKYVNSKSKVSMFAVEPSLTICGYGEGKIENGTIRVDVILCITGGVDVSYTSNYFYVVPFYVKIGVGGQVSATAKFNLHNDRGFQLVCYEGTITPSLNASIEGGLGTKGVASIGAEGKAELAYTKDFVTSQSNATLKGTATIVLGMWKFEKKLKLAEKKIKIYDSNDKSSGYDDGEKSLYEQLDEQPFQLKSRNYLTCSDNRDGASSDDMEISQIESSDANPVVIVSNGTTYKFWLQENGSGEISNDSRLVYAKYNGGVWSEAIAVDNDSTADFYFDVKEKDGKIYIVWQDTKTVFDDSTVTVEDMAGAAEINYVVLNTTNDTMSDIVELTDNDVLDSLPVVTVSGTTAYIAWYYTEDSVLDENAHNYIKYTSVDAAGGISPVQSYDCGTKSVSQLEAMQQNGVPTVVFNLFSETEDISTEGLYTIDMSTNDVKTITEDKRVGNVVYSSLNGEQMTFWIQGGNIVYAPSVSDSVNKVFDIEGDEVGFSKEFTVLDTGNRTYVLWGAKNNETDNNIIYASYYENGKWSPSYKVTELSGGELKNLSAREENEKIVISYMQIFYDEDGEIQSSRMNEKIIYSQADIALDEVTFDSDVVEAGSVLPIELEVTNVGNSKIDKAYVTILCGDDEFEKTIENLDLAEGASQVIAIDDYIVPDELSEEEILGITFKVKAEDDVNDQNGVQEDKIGYTHIISEKQNNVLVDNVEYYVLKITNCSHIDASDVKVKVLADSQDGAIIYDNTVGDFGAGDEEYAYIPATALKDSSEAYVYIDSTTPMRSNGAEYWMFTCNDEMFFEVVENTLQLEETVGGTIEGESGQYKSFDAIPLKAQAQSGYIFDGWETDAGTFEDLYNETTVFNMPEENAVVRAVFVEDTPIVGLQFANHAEEMFVGDEQKIEVMADSGLASWNQLIWSSDNEEVAVVDNRGNVMALASGEVTITAVSKSNSEEKVSCTITVKDKMVESIEMLQDEYILDRVGQEDQLQIMVNPEDYSEKLVWTSDNEKIITVDDDGMIHAVGHGETIVKVSNSDGTIYDECKVHVYNPLTAISLSESDVSMKIGSSKTVSVIYNPEDTTDAKDVVWTNYSTNVVEITTSGANMEKLNIKAIGSGIALIEADVNGLVSYLTVEVIIPITNIYMQSSVTIEEGCSYDIYYEVEPYDATEHVTWSSSNTNVATVENGYIYAKSKGSAIIRVESDSGKYAICNVTVTERTYDDTKIVSSISGFETSHPYENYMEKMYVYTKSGAEKIQVTFSSDTNLEDGYDYIYIQDKDGNEIGKYTGTELAGKTITVPGSTFKLLIITDGSGTEYGFKVTAISESYDIAKSSIKVDRQYYTGSPVTPKAVVTVGNTTLTENKDYVISYANNVNVGVATLTVQGIGISKGSKTANFEIILPELSKVTSLKQIKTTTKNATLSWNAVGGATGYQIYAYNSSQKKYNLVKTIAGVNNVTYKLSKLKAAKEYKYAVCAYIAYNGKVSNSPMEFITIKTATKQASLKGKAQSGKVLLKWKKVAKADGYEIYYANKKKGKYKKVATINKGKTTSKVLKVKKGKNHFYKIRTFRKSGSGKIYSAYSKAVSVK